MKKILIVGAAGMAGHMIYKYLRSTGKYDVVATTRKPTTMFESFAVDVEKDLGFFKDIINTANVDIIINCIGLLVKPSQDNPSKAAYLNSFLPHLLEDLTKDTKTKVIHLSTDCIFDGREGPYSEGDIHTETNWYGRSKSLGELDNGKDLTMRTSIIGPELKEDGTGLFHWFSKQKGDVAGYSNHYWNGITTLEMAKQIDKVLDLDVSLTGIYHFCPKTLVTKGDLLVMIKDIWKRTNVEVTLAPADEGLNKGLVNNRKDEYDPEIPSYAEQFKELKAFQTV